MSRHSSIAYTEIRSAISTAASQCRRARGCRWRAKRGTARPSRAARTRRSSDARAARSRPCRALSTPPAAEAAFGRRRALSTSAQSGPRCTTTLATAADASRATTPRPGGPPCRSHTHSDLRHRGIISSGALMGNDSLLSLAYVRIYSSVLKIIFRA